MALGVNYETQTGDIIPVVKYNAKAGRWFRSDRGDGQTEEIDITKNFSAMFDPLRIADPGSFRVDRPSSDYILWGDGLHTCFGAHLNRVALPAMLKPLLRRPGLRRAAGPAGQIDCQGTPFPVHFWVESDAT